MRMPAAIDLVAGMPSLIPMMAKTVTGRYQMMKFMTALMVGTAMLAAPDARAATYVTYTIGATVTGGFSAFKAFGAVFTIPVDDIQGSGTFYNDLNNSAIGPGATSIGSSNGNLTFEQRGRVRGDSRLFLSACTPVAYGGLPTTAGSIAIDSSCSSASVVLEGLPLYNYTNATGVVTSLAVSLSETADQGLGLTSFTTFVPEPTTWALMLAGFGMVGYAMRKRRPQVVYA